MSWKERKEGFNTKEEDSELKEYEWDEIKKHNKKSDLWVVIYNRVYDVTEFGIDHPGGVDVLQGVSRKGINVKLKMSISGHTVKARKYAKKWLIGKVKDEQCGNLFSDLCTEKDELEFMTKTDTKTDTKTAFELTNTWITMGVLSVAAGVAYGLKAYGLKN
eukprot:792010_1